MLGINPGTLQNGVTFSNGITGQAFSFDGVSQVVGIPYSATLSNSTFSVETWVNPASQVGGWLGQAFVFGQSYGRQLVVRSGNRGLGVAWQISNDPWTFYQVDSSGEIPIGEWTHLVGTWDGSYLSLYINGALDQQAPLDTFSWDPGCPFSIGAAGSCGPDQYFPGLIDEVTYYNQALSAADVQALYNAGSAGKCPLPPAIVSSPGSQTVTVGNDAILQVRASGSSLGYQWYLNGVAIDGATQSTLYLANVQSGNAGTYTVQVSNGSVSVTSDGAVVTVVPAVAVTIPGMVAWWRGEDDFTTSPSAEDAVGNNSGTPRNYLDENDGKVGRAFEFNGAAADLLIQSPAGLSSSSWGGLTIEGWINPANVSIPQPIMEQFDPETGQKITVSLSAAGPGSLDVSYTDGYDAFPLSSPAGALWPGVFQHIALVYAGSADKLDLYINGQLVATGEPGLDVALGASDLYFGSSPSGTFIQQDGLTPNVTAA